MLISQFGPMAMKDPGHLLERTDPHLVRIPVVNLMGLVLADMALGAHVVQRQAQFTPAPGIEIPTSAARALPATFGRGFIIIHFRYTLYQIVTFNHKWLWSYHSYYRHISRIFKHFMNLRPFYKQQNQTQLAQNRQQL
jgi:hypothetical protein